MTGRVRRLLGRFGGGGGRVDPASSAPTTSEERASLPRSSSRARLVDDHTRTWWSGGDTLPTTLIEAEGNADVAARQERWVRVTGVSTGRPVAGRPRANPAFTEALFIELMRAGQLRRAFAQLSPDCQARWGSLDQFVEAQPQRELRAVEGVEVRDVRYLDAWTDPATHIPYADVAELDVEYRLADGRRRGALRQTVHLVGVDGAWRSLYHPRD